MKKILVLAIFGMLIFSLAGCETIKGFGKDVSTVGGWLTKGSESVQQAETSK